MKLPNNGQHDEFHKFAKIANLSDIFTQLDNLAAKAK
jgi:hypothetical protein